MWSCAIYVDENRDVAMSFIAAIVTLQIGSEGVCKDKHQTSQGERRTVGQTGKSTGSGSRSLG